MSKFIKVADWSHVYGYYNNPKILYINADLIEKFYRYEDHQAFNFDRYFENTEFT